MKKKITFWGLLGNWFWVSIVLRLINSYTLQIPILDNIIMVAVFVVLLIYPVYPPNLEIKYTPKQCRLFIRLCGVVGILLSFAVRTNF